MVVEVGKLGASAEVGVVAEASAARKDGEVENGPALYVFAPHARRKQRFSSQIG